MAVTRELKYVYSAADRREFLFDRVLDPEETRSRGEVPVCQTKTAQMRDRLWEHYRSRGHTADLDDNGWKLYPQPTISADPDAALGRQDHPWAEPMRTIPGYTDPD